MRSGVALALAVALVGSAQAEDELTTKNVEFVTENVNRFGDCAGYFRFMAEVFDAADQPATARQLKDLANGARMSAAYLLALEYAAKGKPPKKVGDFIAYPQGREETTLNRMRALLEQGNKTQIEVEQKRCFDALPMQDELIQKMRNDFVDR